MPWQCLVDPRIPGSLMSFRKRGPAEQQRRALPARTGVGPRGKPVRTQAEAEAFASYLFDKKIGTRVIEQGETKKQATFVTMNMVVNLPQKQAEKYRAIVLRYAEQYKISPSLVFAIIRTESNFNPYAVSSAPAYGLMQLVPTSSSREA